MSDTTLNKKNYNSEIDSSEEYINLSKILRTVYRKKNIFLSFVSLSLIIGILYSKVKRPTWEGQFQIVLEDKSNKSQYQKLLNNQLLQRLTSENRKNDLKTEIKILESPSILQPVFNFVKSEYEKLKPTKKVKLNYRAWSNNSLKVKLEPETSVLTISYLDKEKPIILPVLEKISLTYQKYSGRDQEKSINQGIIYLEDQIKKVNIESSQDLLKLQRFAQKNFLGNEDGIRLDDSFSQRESIETLNYNQQVNDRQKLKLANLRRLEAEYVEMSAILTPESKVIKTLQEKINAYKKSIIKPEEVLVEYRNLLRKSTLKEKLLVKLEAELAALKLDKAKQTDPWELISTPTLLNSPAGISNDILISLSLIFGILIGIIGSLINESLSGKLFEIDDFLKILPFPLIKTLSLKREELWGQSIDLISQEIVEANNKGNLSLIVISEKVISDKIISIKSRFEENLKSSNKKVILTSNLIDAKTCLNKILICISGTITKNELMQFKEDILIQDNEVKGIIFIDN